MRGHQSGVQGIRVAMLAFSREIETVCGLSVRFPAPTPLISCKISPQEASKAKRGKENE